MVRYLENSIENMRDIGGYKNNLGYRLGLGKLIRSNLPQNLSDEDVDIIKEMGIDTIIDLRTCEEIETKKSVFEDDNSFKVYHIGIDVGKEIPKSEELVSKSYISMLTLREKMKMIFEIVGNHDKVLYFCDAGKDRTGVVTALLLKLLGVSEEDIIEDYIATKEYMKENLIKYANSNEDILNIITPKRVYMERFLREFKEKYKSVEKYLEFIGIEEEIINNIKNLY